VTEGTIQWVLYERSKKLNIAFDDGRNGISQWVGMMVSTGSAKLVSTVVTYPLDVFSFESFHSENTLTDYDINRCFVLGFDNQLLTESSDTRVYGTR
jgi:hypothetical protein